MTRRTMTKPCLTMDLGAGRREWVVVGGFQESGKLLASQGNGEEGSPVGWTGKGWKRGCCRQHIVTRMALTATSTGQCLYPGISIHFAYSLVKPLQCTSTSQTKSSSGENSQSDYHANPAGMQLSYIFHPPILPFSAENLRGCAAILPRIASWSTGLPPRNRLLGLCRWGFSLGSL